MVENKFIFIAGVRKAGTTTLYDLLSQHPNVYFPTFKETQFFAQNEDIVKSNIDWYLDLFSKDAEYNIDGSTLYFNDELSMHLISEFFKDPKVIVILRDPAKRAYSSFLHMQKQPSLPDKRSFNEILEYLERANKDIKLAEDNLLNEALSKKNIDLSHIDEVNDKRILKKPYKSDIRNKRSIYKYFSESLYREKLELYKQIFGGNLKIIFFENLISKTDEVLSEVIEFLGLEKFQYNLDHRNKTLMPSGTIARKMLKMKNNLIQKSKHRDKIFNSPAYKFLKNNFKKVLFDPKDKMSEEELKRVQNVLKSEYEFWEKNESRIHDIWL